ncbi:1-phosphofructokinase family hexose kinase [Bombilactobacillus bombi]|uniref:Tagatose-6-phosphate kinase n=1 Tax=Bombilactobacillus bombi TaxID=1303590 RepID=A0A3R6YP66_9LACO|nr:hexose kinase [Bombilactobacillus bombi]RHW46299.1 1-phosphofructokinase family hexose kinase [Bombilactobacillus bombi]
MILTITISPSIDRLYKIDDLKIGNLNRAKLIKKMVGGKGINAARVASQLGAKAIATGFLGGENGRYILKQAQKDSYIPNFVQVNGETRNCYTIIQSNSTKTEINEIYNSINLSDLDRLLDKIRLLITTNNIKAVSINGSFPKQLPLNFYSSVISIIRKINPDINIILDTSGTALKSVLKSSQQLDYIKPNEQELAELLETKVTVIPQILKQYLQNSLFERVNNIFVSLGSYGAIVKHYNDYLFVDFDPVNVINTEGSGDSVVGGLLYALDCNMEYEDVIRYAIASGTANAMETKTGYIEKNNVNNLVKKLRIKYL